MASGYIEPRFIITNSYDKLMELGSDEFSFLMHYEDDAERIGLSDIIERPLVFIVAEPGHGKTRLIDELSARTGRSAVRVNFKTKVHDRPVDEWLSAYGVSSSSETVFLDGLDEAPAQYVQSTIFSLIEFIRAHPKMRFYISCRIHYFSKYQTDFAMLPSAEFLMIKPLERSHARKLLSNMTIPDATITTLFATLSSGDDTSILQSPRYLEMIAKEIVSGRADPALLNRATLFESFTFSALCEEDNKNGRQLAAYKKRMLELLALTMEVAQFSQITTDDFVTFMERAASDVKLIVGQVDIENIYEHSLLNKDLDGNLSFTNREIQEYFAARYLLRMGNPSYKVFSLAIEPQLRDVIPSWRNTLSYVIDELPAVARHIVSLDPNRIILDESTALLVTGSTSGKMSQEDMSYIFRYIWEQYNRRQNFIVQELSFNLAHYADNEGIAAAYAKLKSRPYKVKKNYPIEYINIINLCGNLLALNRFDRADRQEVVDKLVRIALGAPSTTVQINALHALKSVDDRGVLDRLSVLSDSPDNSVFSYVERLAFEIAPESELAIDIYIKSIKRKAYYSARKGIESLGEPGAIDYFLRKLADDSELIESIIRHDRVLGEERSNFLRHIKDDWRSAWLVPLKAFIIRALGVDSGYYAERSAFVESVVRLIVEHDHNYYAELLGMGVENHNMLVRIDSMLAKIIQTRNVLLTADTVKALGDKGFLVFRVFSDLETRENPQKSAVLSEARKLMPDQFAEHDAQQRRFIRQNAYNSATARFNREYGKIEDHKLSGALWETSAAIVNYLENTSQRKEVLSYTKKQAKRIWDILRTNVLDTYDLSDIRVTITKQDGRNISYTITRKVELFERAFIFGYLTKQPDLPQYKDKLLTFFPYMNFDGKKLLFMDLVLSEHDQQKIINAYVNTSIDSARYQIYDFIEFVEGSRIIAATGVLRKIVLEEGMQDYVREYALKTVESIAPNKEFLERVHDQLEIGTDDDRSKLLRSVDDLLIVNHADDGAIKRRLSDMQLAVSDSPLRVKGVEYQVTDAESELLDKNLAKPLMALHDPLYVEDFLSLLAYSFEISQKGGGWTRYAQYLWDVTTQYFENVVVQRRNDDIVFSIARTVERYPALATANYLRYLSVIKARLLEQVGSKKPYVEAINTVNAMNSTDTLTITSEAELFYSTKDLIDELDRWLRQEGRSMVERGTETEVQRQLDREFENILLNKYGSSNVRTRIYRETQAVDGTRTDFYVYFGFYGPIIIELKLSSHPDLSGEMKSKESFKSMEKYMKKFSAQYGVLLIHRTKGTTAESFSKKVRLVQQSYSNIEGVSVMSIGEDA